MNILPFVSGVTHNITNKTAPKSIPSSVVGDAFIDLATLTKNTVDQLDNNFEVGKADAVTEIGKNKFNKATVVSGNYVTKVGVITSSSTNSYSQPIPIVLNENYTFRSAINNSGARFLTALDANGVAIPSEGSDISISSKTFTNPLVKSIILSVNNNGLADFQMEIGSATPYSSYTEKKVLKSEQIPTEVRVKSAKLVQNDLSFSEKVDGSNNLFNPNDQDVAIGFYINSTGTEIADPLYNTTGFIKIDEGDPDVAVSRHRFSVFFDEHRVSIPSSFSSTSASNVVRTIPADAVYYRVSVPVLSGGVQYWDNLMINYGGEILPYESFYKGYYLLKDVKIESNSADEVLVFLPREIYLAVGSTIEIYNSQAAWAGNLDNYHFFWTGAGKSMKRKWTMTGVIPADLTLTLRVFNNAMEQVATAQTVIKVVSATLVDNVSIVPIGDSLTNSKSWLPKLIELSGGKISLQGTRGAVQVAPARTHEGRSGWKAKDYLENKSYAFDASGQIGLDGRTQDLNPFYNPNDNKIDWEYYKSNYNKNPDNILIWLGTNGIALDPTANVNAIKTFIDGLRSTGALSVPMLVALTLFRGDQNGIGNQLGTDGYVANSAWKLEEDRKVFNLQVALYDALKDYPNLFFIPISLCHDSEYNFTPNGATTPVNPWAWQTEALASDGTHPQLAGYNQIARMILDGIIGANI